MTGPHIMKRTPEAEAVSCFGLAGRFRLVVSGPDGSVRRELAFDNLILDAGLNRLGTDAAIAFCAIGTGTAAPAISQTVLQAQSQNTSTIISSTATNSGASTPRWTGQIYQFRFAIGSLNGNYSEIGVGWSTTLMYARALIVDGGGAPTTITVGAGEQLDVYYERRVYPPAGDVVTTNSIGGVSTTVTVRSQNSANSTVWDASSYPHYNQGGNPLGTFCEAYNGAIGAVTGVPSGTSGAPSSASNSAYSNNSYTRNVVVTFAPAEAVLAGGITAAVCRFKMAALQVGFSPAIAKTSLNTLVLTYTTSWARRP